MFWKKGWIAMRKIRNSFKKKSELRITWIHLFRKKTFYFYVVQRNWFTFVGAVVITRTDFNSIHRKLNLSF